MKRDATTQRSLLRGNAGLTLVEVMMTLLIFATVLAVVNNVFITSQGLYGRTSARADQQMSARAGLGIIIQELRSAGCDPTGAGIGGLVSATTDTVRVRADLDASGDITTNEPSEDVMYFYDGVAENLVRDPGAGGQVIVNNVTNFTIQYLDENAQPLGPLPLDSTLRAQVRTIEIIITTDTMHGGQVDASTRILLRNLQG